MHHLASDWRRAGLAPPDVALCEWAEVLTLRPADATEEHIEDLRRHGFTPRAIHDAAQVIAVFNYLNRLADALGLEPETFIRPWEKGPDPE